MIAKSSENELIAQCVEAISSTGFAQKIVNYIAHLVPFDCAVILGCRANKHPIYLYDSIATRRELLFQRYLTNSFINDPFYIELSKKGHEGVYRLVDITASKDLAAYTQYQQQFYNETGWVDELSISVRIDEHRWIVIYLGLLENKQRFSAIQKNKLTAHFNLIKALCRQHWGSQLLLLGPLNSSATGQLIERGLATFASEQLTPRERQIAMLLVQGCDSNDIATQLNITLGTVKNHRKRIYAQLKVSSLSEFFQLFLNHLITSQ
ncbi:LuxR C-terminal-related transcriptional regulator [Pseudoalteromonas sp.]|uniref:LuxR C-terminal-related transcriptional regulator n=1 Tax=Pseudoalteromonas sp. TaxID=53249 RepID=UPI003565530E